MNNREGLFRLKSLESPDSTFWAAEPPLVIERGRGSIVYDTEGRSYIDLCAGFGALPLGHAHPSMLNILKVDDEIPRIIHGLGDVCPSRDKIEFLTTLRQLLPEHLTLTSLALSGSQAVETALKTAMLATGSYGFVALHGAYHGVDFGALPLTARAEFRKPFFPWINQASVKHLPINGDLAAFEKAIEVLKKSAHGFAGIIVEPIQGRGGMVAADSDWLASLADLSHRNGGLLILDEVFTGLGRIGSMSTAFEVHADMITLGKALGGGFPLSACVGTEACMRAWPINQGEAIHTGTFFGHPLSCRVGRATLEEIKAQDLPRQALASGRHAIQFLTENLGQIPGIKDIRGQGLFLAIEFHAAGQGAAFMTKLMAEGILAIPCGDHGEGISFTPALNIDQDLWQQALNKIVTLLS